MADRNLLHKVVFLLGLFTCGVGLNLALASNIGPPATSWTDGQVLFSSALNGNFNQIFNDYNGNITDFNIASGANINLSKLATVGSTSVTALQVFGGSNAPGGSTGSAAYNRYDRSFIMGGASNMRALPTSGAISGDFYTSGNWTQTGPITATSVRIYSLGTITTNNTFTVNTEIAGGQGGHGNAGVGASSSSGGGGYGGGSPCCFNTLTLQGGGGGSFGGSGGFGGLSVGDAILSFGGSTYPISSCLSGSGGAGGSGQSGGGNNGGNGGNGGGSLYIESVGAVTFASGTSLTLNGGAGGGGNASTGSGGGGSGGGLEVRSLSTVTIASGATITSTGGAGGNAPSAGCAGGGGGGGIIDMSGSTTTNSGTVTAGGGAAGTGGTVAAGAGASGVVTLNSFIQGPRSAP